MKFKNQFRMITRLDLIERLTFYLFLQENIFQPRYSEDIRFEPYYILKVSFSNRI